MRILLPKSSTGGENENWQTVDHVNTATIREQMKSFEGYFSALSSRTKEIEEKIAEIYVLKADITKSKEDATDALTKISRTEGLMFFGFFALLLVVIGIAYGYWQFVFDSSKNEDYKYGLSEKIAEQAKQLDNLKKCLKGGGWNSCFN